MNILELYSGIGGMHMALSESGIDGKIAAAVEINTVANLVYSHNFQNTLLLNKNIQSLSDKFISKLNVNGIFMSPPCQPFTRNGLKGDESDPRTCSFTHILNILPQLDIKYLLIENVKGFETSAMHTNLIQTLNACQFSYQEFILSPTQIGISNTRYRYYCIAKKRPLKFSFNIGELSEEFPFQLIKPELFQISDIIETNIDVSAYLIPNNILLKRVMLMDICNPESRRSCCFTKAYGKYVEGTGSVFTPKTKEETNRIFKNLENFTPSDSEYLRCLKELQLRYFTAKEVARLMAFPEYFQFPENITTNQRYRLLGNSINVKLVAKLIQLLVTS